MGDTISRFVFAIGCAASLPLCAQSPRVRTLSISVVCEEAMKYACVPPGQTQLAEQVRKVLDFVFDGYVLQSVSPAARAKCGELRITLDSSPEEYLLSARLWEYRFDCSAGPRAFEPFPFPIKLLHQRTPNEGAQPLASLLTWLRQAIEGYLSTNIEAMRTKVYGSIPFGSGARLLAKPELPYTPDKFQTVLPVRKFDNNDRAEAKFFAWNSFKLDFQHEGDRHEVFLRGRGCAADMEADAAPPTPPAPPQRAVRAVPDHFRDQESQQPLSTLLPRLVDLPRENFFYLQPGDSGQGLGTPSDCNVVAPKDN